MAGIYVTTSDIQSATNALLAARNRYGLSVSDINQNYDKVKADQINTLNNSIRSMKANTGFAIDITNVIDSIVGSNIVNSAFESIKTKSDEFYNYCSCDCNRCTCDCDNCSCDCDYNPCSCDCDRCTCDCDNGTCDCVSDSGCSCVSDSGCSCVSDNSCPCTCNRCLVGCDCVGVGCSTLTCHTCTCESNTETIPGTCDAFTTCPSYVYTP